MNPLAPPFPPAPAPGPDGKPQEGPPPIGWGLALGMGGAVLGSLASNLDTRLTTFSLADLRGGVGYGVDESSWVSLAYNIAEVAVVPMTPWLASIVSPRRAIAGAAVLLTVAGGFVPSAAPDLPWLVGLRFLQGMGGGALIPLLLLTVLRFTPMHQRVIGLTVYSFVTAATPLCAEGLSGLLLDAFGWQAIYYIALPLGPLVVFMTLVGLPVEKVKLEVFADTDYGGMLLLALFAGMLTAALDQGQRLDWFDSPLIDSLFVGAAFFLAAFISLELTLEKPLIDLSLLRRFNFSGGLLMIFAFAFTSLLTGSIIPTYGQQVRGFRQDQVGSILIWGVAVQVAICLPIPFLLRALEARVVLAIGLITAVTAYRLGTFIDSDWVGGNLLLVLALSAAAQILVLVPTTVVSTSTLEAKDALSGGTIFNVVRDLAITGTGAVATGIMTVRERVHSFYLTDHLVRGAPVTVAREGVAGLGALAQATRIQATVEAVADTLGWSAMVLLAAFALVAALRQTPVPRPPRRL